MIRKWILSLVLIQSLLVAQGPVVDQIKTHYLTSAVTTNSTNVKASAGLTFLYSLINTTTTLYYLRLYDSATAPTCSSSTGFIESIPIPASTTGAGIVRSQPFSQSFVNGISYCLTLNGASNDNNAAATGVYITILWK